MNHKDVIDRLKKSEADLKQAGVTHLYLFGSTARDEAHPDSDVDLFFRLRPRRFWRFRSYGRQGTCNPCFGARTDMIPRDGLHRVLRKRIEASALQIF